MSVVEGLKIQIHVCGTYFLSILFTLLIVFDSVCIFSRTRILYGYEGQCNSSTGGMGPDPKH